MFRRLTYSHKSLIGSEFQESIGSFKQVVHYQDPTTSLSQVLFLKGHPGNLPQIFARTSQEPPADSVLAETSFFLPWVLQFSRSSWESDSLCIFPDLLGVSCSLWLFTLIVVCICFSISMYIGILLRVAVRTLIH